MRAGLTSEKAVPAAKIAPDKINILFNAVVVFIRFNRSLEDSECKMFTDMRRQNCRNPRPKSHKDAVLQNRASSQVVLNFTATLERASQFPRRFA